MMDKCIEQLGILFLTEVWVILEWLCTKIQEKDINALSILQAIICLQTKSKELTLYLYISSQKHLQKATKALMTNMAIAKAMVIGLG